MTNEVCFVGTIDRKIYQCVSNKLITEEVIITKERMRHIMERHPGDYEMYCTKLKEIIENPDYIMESNKDNTALILKEIVLQDNIQFKAVVRMATVTDNLEYKNSIITFMKINRKEWNRLINNKTILYKKE